MTILVGGSILAGLVALTYAAFAVFIVAAIVDPSRLTSCGCFGEADTPPTAWHVVVNVGAAVIAIIAAVAAVPGLRTVLAEQPAGGLPFVAFVGLGIWFAYLTLAVLPTVIPRAEA